MFKNTIIALLLLALTASVYSQSSGPTYQPPSISAFRLTVTKQGGVVIHSWREHDVKCTLVTPQSFTNSTSSSNANAGGMALSCVKL